MPNKPTSENPPRRALQESSRLHQGRLSDSGNGLRWVCFSYSQDEPQAHAEHHDYQNGSA